MSEHIALIGENNPYNSPPEFALYCYPPGCAGYRLRRILGLPQHQYLALHRENLCEGDWSTRGARERARAIVADAAFPRCVVMFGRKVADAFGYDRPFFSSVVVASAARCSTNRDTHTRNGSLILVSLPHPSGRNAGSWNARAIVRAREILSELVPEIAWGCIDKEAAA